MAERKETKGKRAQNQTAKKHLSEGSPNPHGENKVIQMPINTDQRNATGGRNIPQVPNTVGGKMNPSVVHEFKRRVLTEDDDTREKSTRRKKDA
jgi:hypothetical protein